MCLLVHGPICRPVNINHHHHSFISGARPDVGSTPPTPADDGVASPAQPAYADIPSVLANEELMREAMKYMRDTMVRRLSDCRDMRTPERLKHMLISGIQTFHFLGVKFTLGLFNAMICSLVSLVESDS